MSHHKLFRKFIVIATIALSSLGYSQMVGPWDLDKLYVVPKWEVTTLAAKDGMTSLLITSVDYKGKPVQFFAYYSAPKTGVMPVGGWPAMVHAPGGGGTAYSQWVTYFNDHGYAAISLDLEGHIPTEDATGAYLPSPNPGPSRNGVFGDYALPIAEQWYYHAISQVILAHTLIASFPEVNAAKIGLSGASWGGTITSCAMGVDNRWSWAVPVYGAGYLDDSDGAQGTSISGAKATFVNQYYDASLYFDRVDFPTLFINGTNDLNFAMPVNQNSANAVNGNIRFSLGFGHSNLAVLRLDELFTFANQVTYGGLALPTFGTPSFNSSNVATVNVTAAAGLKSGELLYTVDTGYWYERVWLSIPATISGNKLTATLPEGTTTFYFTATDSRGLMTSTKYVETDDGSIPAGNPNIAIYGTATQSSTAYSGDASRAIDQNTDGVYANASVTNTNAETNAWWQVALDGSHSIDNIVIYNRTDAAYMSRLTNFTVSVINSSGIVTFSKTYTSYPNPSITVDAGGAIGSIVKIQLNATNTTLNLAEVQVFEVENSPVSVTNVSVSPASKTLTTGSTVQLTAIVSPSDATDPGVNWRSSNTAVATVNETTGLVTALSAGSATITATTIDGELTSYATITVTSATAGSDNLAPYGIATQSTTAYSGDASRAIDKNTSGIYTDNSVSHTGATTGEWWMVTLANSYTINSIKVFNRTDAAYMDRLNNFTVQVLNSNNQIVYTQTITSTPNPSVTLTIPSVVGNRVRILQNKATTALALAEVEVYGTTTTLSTNSALEKDKNIFSISPNPVKDIVTIKLETTEAATYRIFDMTGQLLVTGSINNGTTTVDLSHIAQGLYFIKVSNGNTSATQKIIKK